MRRIWALFTICTAALLLGRAQTPQSGARDNSGFDVVIANGRVLDPESGLDKVRSIGITDGKIRTVSPAHLSGRKTIDATGLIVVPGFIDLHQHDNTAADYKFKAMDGVTSALELETGTADVDRWYAERKDKALINYGVSAGHVPVRMKVMGENTPLPPTGDAAHKAASAGQIEEMSRQIRYALERGAVAVGIKPAWTPGASAEEILQMFRVGAQYHALAIIHLRYQGPQEPSGAQALEEAIAAAAITGAPVHVVHITLNGMRETPQLLRMIDGAHEHGMDITTEVYPYTAASNPINSTLFDEGWQERFGGIDYKDLQWAATGERLTAETFAKYHRTNGRVLIHCIPENMVQAALADPLTIVASDGSGGHPRMAGTYARVLGKYVREDKVLTLMDAIRRMSLMPAQRLESRVPGMKNKGRIRVAADADLTVFDPQQISDKATYEQPNVYSAGVRYLLVNGAVVIDDGRLQDNIAPGTPIRAPIQ